jgi:hypothetical protein
MSHVTSSRHDTEKVLESQPNISEKEKKEQLMEDVEGVGVKGRNTLFGVTKK